MSTFDAGTVGRRLSAERMATYLDAADDDERAALELYDWNVRAAGALYEDIGRVEVVLRNAFDVALSELGARRGWRDPWFERRQLFPGRHGARAVIEIDLAAQRARRRGVPVVHGRVIAELTFGFWRYLCAPTYLTSLWAPALAGAFPAHPGPNARVVRRDVEREVQRLHFLRNRIAHHEPIHRRDLGRDLRAVLRVAGWMSADAAAWIAARSRTPEVLDARPRP
jgi:hypothetical protein